MKSRTSISVFHRPGRNPSHASWAGVSTVFGAVAAIATPCRLISCSTVREAEQPASVPSDHELLVSGNYPTRDLAGTRRYSWTVARVRRVVELEAEPGRRLADTLAYLCRALADSG